MKYLTAKIVPAFALLLLTVGAALAGEPEAVAARNAALAAQLNADASQAKTDAAYQQHGVANYQATTQFAAKQNAMKYKDYYGAYVPCNNHMTAGGSAWYAGDAARVNAQTRRVNGTGCFQDGEKCMKAGDWGGAEYHFADAATDFTAADNLWTTARTKYGEARPSFDAALLILANY